MLPTKFQVTWILFQEKRKIDFQDGGHGCNLLTYNKSLKGLPLETKNTQNHENRRLGLTESLHMRIVVCEAAYAPSAGLSGI